MRRAQPFNRCERKRVPRHIRAEILSRQSGRCADCDTRLILGSMVFDHRPPLALRDEADDANDPDRLAAICGPCNERKTSRDIKAIAKAKRLAEAHQGFIARHRDKVPGRRVPSRSQWDKVQRYLRGTPDSNGPIAPASVDSPPPTSSD